MASGKPEMGKENPAFKAPAAGPIAAQGRRNFAPVSFSPGRSI